MDETFWRFREFELDRERFSLRRSGQDIKLDPKPLQLLFLLAERAGAVVSHDEALRIVWGEGVFVDGESALYTAVKKIRRALGDPELVQTVSSRGYRLRFDKLTTSTASEPPAAIERIAVLPLVNLSGDAGQDFFSDGLTEELIATMAKLFRGKLGIIARTSIMRFKSVSRPIEEIARELGVDYIIEGSVRRHNERVRISVQLFRAAGATSLWSETFEQATGDVFALQTEIALAAANSIRFNLGEHTPKHKPSVVDPEVRDHYLRARYLWVQRTRPTIEAAIRHFREVLERDPSFAAAYAGLSCCYALLPITTNRRPLDSFPEAKALATKAIALDASQTEAHIALGLVEFWFHRNWQSAFECFQRAATLNPSDSSGLMFLAHVHSILGRHEEALSTIADAHRLDPLSPIVGTHCGHFLYNAGRFQEAVARLEHVLELNPQFWVAHLMHGKALASLGRTAAALDAFADAHRFGMGNTEALSFSIYTMAKGGDRPRAEIAMGELERIHAAQPASAAHRALANLGLGNQQKALELIEEGFAEHDVRLIFLGVEKRWRDLGLDMYRATLEHAGLPHFANDLAD
jgi:TolB-like protein/Flp pilus assembly protein TadD